MLTHSVTKKKSTKTKAKTTSTIATATTSASSETQSSSKDKRPEFKPIIRKLHTIYPAMGKRSIVDPTATHDQKFYLDHHRNTRHDLFGLIEKYVFAYVLTIHFIHFAYVSPYEMRIAYLIGLVCVRSMIQLYCSDEYNVIPVQSGHHRSIYECIHLFVLLVNDMCIYISKLFCSFSSTWPLLDLITWA